MSYVNCYSKLVLENEILLLVELFFSDFYKKFQHYPSPFSN